MKSEGHITFVVVGFESSPGIQKCISIVLKAHSMNYQPACLPGQCHIELQCSLALDL